MKYRVIWDEIAEQELANIWLGAHDRDSVTRAAEWLDRCLAGSPLGVGESRASSVRRIAF